MNLNEKLFILASFIIFPFAIVNIFLNFRLKRIMSSVKMQHFVSELKSKNFETRKEAARNLIQYVNFINFLICKN